MLKNCKVLHGGSLTEGSIAVQSGRICFIGKEASAPSTSETINLKGNVVLPGLCDVHTHLRDLNQSYKEDFYTGTCSALAGGFTTVLDMPISTAPSESLKQLEDKIRVASAKTVANVGFHSGFPETKEALRKVKRLGAFSLKIYMNRRENLDGGDDQAVEEALIRARETGLPVTVHAEELHTIERLEGISKDSREDSVKAFLRAHPPRTEANAVENILSMAPRTGAQIHFCHLSTAQSIDLLRSAKAAGSPVSCEATPHHLFLTSKVARVFGGRALMVPPLRNAANRRAVWHGLYDRTIDLVASDHAPHTLEEKERTDIWKVPPGIPGLETTLPLLLTALNRGTLTLTRVQELLAERPCKYFGVQSKGFIKVGLDADLIAVDMKRTFIVNPETFHTKAKYSPFEGWKLTGKAVKAFVGGRLAMDEGEILVKLGSGSVIRRLY